ncbi:hypothetical protein PM082_015218 [Marasmius tenuissimus]|nr:hypothetical protein PM082_015218 [Marasmius tenuissimus]
MADSFDIRRRQGEEEHGGRAVQREMTTKPSNPREEITPPSHESTDLSQHKVSLYSIGIECSDSRDPPPHTNALVGRAHPHPPPS